jgi:hypothetical protein
MISVLYFRTIHHLFLVLTQSYTFAFLADDHKYSVGTGGGNSTGHHIADDVYKTKSCMSKKLPIEIMNVKNTQNSGLCPVCLCPVYFFVGS